MPRQNKAEREKRANVLEARGFQARLRLLNRPEGSKQAVILSAGSPSRAGRFSHAEARERPGRGAEARRNDDPVSGGEIGPASASRPINYFVAAALYRCYVVSRRKPEPEGDP